MMVQIMCKSFLLLLILLSYTTAGYSSPIDQLQNNDMGINKFITDKYGHRYLMRDNKLYFKSNLFGNAWGIKAVGVRSASLDPDDSEIMYMITTDNKVKKTSDNGKSWKIIENGLPQEDVLRNRIFINPHNNKEIFLCSSSGLYKSSNAGENWISTGMKEDILQFIVNPKNKDIFYVLTRDGLFLSKNSGETWGRFDNNLPTITVKQGRTAKKKPIHVDNIALFVQVKSYILAHANNRIFRTENNGTTWEEIKNEPSKNQRKIDDNFDADTFSSIYEGLLNTEPLYKVPSYGFEKGVFHPYGVKAVALSHDGKYLVVSNQSYNCNISVFDMNTHEKIVTLPISPGGALSLVFSPDDKYLVLGGGTEHTGYVRIISVDDWKQIYSVETSRMAIDSAPIAFSPDGYYLIVGGDYKIKIIEVGTWAELNVISQSTHISAIAFSPIDKYFAVGDRNGIVQIFKKGSWEKIAEIKRPDKLSSAFTNYIYVRSLAFSPDGQNLAVGYHDDTARYNYVMGRGQQEVPPFFSSLRLYRAESWEEITKLRGHVSVEPINFSSDGHLLISGNSDISTNIFAVNTWNLLRQIEGFRIEAFNKHWAIGNLKGELVLLDFNKLSLFFLRKDMLKLGFEDSADAIVSSLQKNETHFNNEMKIIAAEKEESLSKLTGIPKDEFETTKEYEERLKQRNQKSSEINQNYELKRLNLRRELSISLMELLKKFELQFDTTLASISKPIDKLDIKLEEYIADRELFLLTINENGVEFFSSFIYVPRAVVKNFKENINKFQISGKAVPDRTGRMRLENIKIKNPETGDTYSVQPIMSDSVISLDAL